MSGKRMGFSVHPGDLPFTTIRRQQWANRVWVGDLVEIHGEHGCEMPPIQCVVTAINDYNGPPPPHLVDVYRGQKLCAIELAAADCLTAT